MKYIQKCHNSFTSNESFIIRISKLFEKCVEYGMIPYILENNDCYSTS